MGKSILFIVSIYLTLLNYVTSNHTDPLAMKLTPISALKTIGNKDLSNIQDHLPIDTHDEQEQNKPGVSHVKGRKSADPKELKKSVEAKIADTEKVGEIKTSNISVQTASETGIVVPAVVVPVHSEKLHIIGREGIVESHDNSSNTLNKTIIQKASNVTVTAQKVNSINKIEPKIIKDSTVLISAKTITSTTAVASSTATSTTTKITTATAPSIKTTATTATTTTTTATTTTTTTTTTPKPKKPKITYSVEDIPSIAKIVPEKLANKFPSEKLNVDEPEQPIAQPSQEFETSPMYHGRTDYIIPIVALIFAVPIIMGAMIVAYRRFKDYWSTRHYRRMDFLVDGMYND